MLKFVKDAYVHSHFYILFFPPISCTVLITQLAPLAAESSKLPPEFEAVWRKAADLNFLLQLHALIKAINMVPS